MAIGDDVALLKSTVADVLGLQGSAAEETANATAQGLTATGDQSEVQAYQSAQGIAKYQSDVEAVIGQIQQLQEQRKLTQTLGTQAAGVAASGFSGSSESSMAILRSSLQQGYLGQQLINTQTELNQGGYLEQATATQGEIAAVQAASSAATSLQQSETQAAATATANAANETKALESLLTVNQNDPANANLTPQQLAEAQATTATVTSTLASPLNGPVQLSPAAQPNPLAPGQPVGGTGTGPAFPNQIAFPTLPTAATAGPTSFGGFA